MDGSAFIGRSANTILPSTPLAKQSTGAGPASMLRDALQFGEGAEHQGALVEVEKGRFCTLTADILPQGCPGGQPRRWDQALRKRTFGCRGACQRSRVHEPP